MSFSYFLWLVLGGASLFLGMAALGRPAEADEPGETGDARARRFIAVHEASVRPLEVEVARRWWAANISGSDADYRAKQEAETRLDLHLSDPKTFAELKAIRQARPADPLLAREIEILYLQYLPKQVDPELLKEILKISNGVEQAFIVCRAKVDGRELTDSEVRRVLLRSTNNAERQAVWEASKRVGQMIEADLKRLVALRNQAARKLGYADYHVMQLALGEQSQADVLRMFDDLDALCKPLFHQAKAEIDTALAARYRVAVADLRPWHYHDPFFQEAPQVFGDDSAGLYAKLDIPKLCREFYAGIGLPVDDVLARSDLYERKGKNPHGFCSDLDREGDVRVLVNLVPNKQWLGTLLHELGHAIYSSKNIPRSVHYVLRTDAHALTTEGVAMMFERLSGSAEWLTAMGVQVPEPKRFDAAAAKLRRTQFLVFSRWCQVMFRFEKELYGNPDQDLNRRWWDLVEKYQEVRRPEGRNAPDYAAKIHFVIAPTYYHNYMLGEMFASQLHHAIARDVYGGADPRGVIYAGNSAVGAFMKERVCKPGRTLNWNDLTRHATGAPLSAQALAEDLK